MRRASVVGPRELREAVEALGLDATDDAPDLVVIDADDDAAVAAAVAPATVPRVFVAGPQRAALLRAAGAAHVVERPCSPRTLGPVLFALERGRRRAPRCFLFLAASGATGRTSLVANLALRMAAHATVIALDATGTSALAWRLRVAAAPWADLAAVGEDLGESHVRLAAAERDGVLVLGGVGVPDDGLLRRVVAVARAIGVVLVDGPSPWRAAAVIADADRVVLCANPDPAAAAAAVAALPLCGDRCDLVVSQTAEGEASALAEAFGRPPTFVLPRDERACRDSLRDRGPARGALGRAYDALAEIFAAEATP